MIEEGLTLLSISFFLCCVDEFFFKGASKKKNAPLKKNIFCFLFFAPTASWGILIICSKIFFLKITLKYVFFTFYFLKIRI